MLDPLLARHRDEILRLAERNGVVSVRVFGSRARGDARPDSDFDFLVEFDPRRSLLDQARLMRELKSLLGYEVDVVSIRGLNKHYAPHILRDAVPLKRIVTKTSAASADRQTVMPEA